jgi:hypothetical protein
MNKKIQEAQVIAAAKAEELTTQLGVKVHPLVFQGDNYDEVVIGYIKEPPRAVKIAIMDKSLVGMYSAVEQVLETILIKEHSDPRTYSEKPEHDKIVLGAVMAAYDLIKISINQFQEVKKK